MQKIIIARNVIIAWKCEFLVIIEIIILDININKMKTIKCLKFKDVDKAVLPSYNTLDTLYISR